MNEAGGAVLPGEFAGKRRIRPLSFAVFVAVLRRPALWLTALGAARRMAPTGWWRHRPRRPYAPAYLDFRVHTHTGKSGVSAAPDDVVRYLRWCKENAAIFGSA